MQVAYRMRVAAYRMQVAYRMQGAYRMQVAYWMRVAFTESEPTIRHHRMRINIHFPVIVEGLTRFASGMQIL
jgi:hypothetical protein